MNGALTPPSSAVSRLASCEPRILVFRARDT